MLKVAQLIANGGPGGNDSAWIDAGDNLFFAGATVSTTAAPTAAQIIASADKQTAAGEAAEGLPAAGSNIQRLNGGNIVLPSALAASAALTFALGVYRTLGTLGAQIAAAGGALTSLPVGGNGLTTALPSGQTFSLYNGTQAAQSWTTSAAVAAGATAIPVNSQTPNGTYAAGTAMTGLVGNAQAFGWIGGSGGTPAFAPNSAVTMPAITTNTALRTPANPGGGASFLPLLPLDVIVFLQQTSTGTVVSPGGLLQTLVQ